MEYASNKVPKPIKVTRRGWASKAKGSRGTEIKSSTTATTLTLRSGKKSRLHNAVRRGVANTAIRTSQLGTILEAPSAHDLNTPLTIRANHTPPRTRML
jgi:hypothetical protein